MLRTFAAHARVAVNAHAWCHCSTSHDPLIGRLRKRQEVCDAYAPLIPHARILARAAARPPRPPDGGWTGGVPDAGGRDVPGHPRLKLGQPVRITWAASRMAPGSGARAMMPTVWVLQSAVTWPVGLQRLHQDRQRARWTH